MKQDSDLDQIAREVWFHIRGDITGGRARKLLRDIQIDALREAREMLAPMQVFNVKTDDFEEVSHPALPELDKLIRELELK